MSSSARATFLRDVLNGLRQPQKTLPYKYFYDEIGSRLFEQICETPEYYVTRTETALLQSVAPQVAEAVGERVEVMEFGSGAGEKIRILLRALQQPRNYIPIDISSEILLASAERLRAEFPALTVSPIVMDYTDDKAWLSLPKPEGARRVVFFPGSTLGNFAPYESLAFLKKMRKAAGPNGAVFIGVDLRKDRSILHAAYDDAAGITAAFNLHLLERIRDELGVDVSVEDFRHKIIVNEEIGRVEMHLESQKDHSWHVGGEVIHFRKGETIHTENSHKFTIAGFQNLARHADLTPRQVWTDEKNYFSLHLLEA